MKIAILLPSLANKGPVSVARDIVNCLQNTPNVTIVIFFFDDVCELSFPVECKKVDFWDKSFLKGFDIVHTHGFRPDLYCRLNIKSLNIKSISTLHNNIYKEYLSNYNPIVARSVEVLWKYALSRHDILVSLTSTMKEYYTKLLPNQSIKVINNGRSCKDSFNIDILPEDLTLIKKLKKRNLKIIGTSCLITKRKGLDQIIKAIKSLPNFSFVIIGTGEDETRLKKLTSSLNVADRCLFLGYRPNAVSYLKYFDIYIISSYSEGLPLALLEAAEAGKACVCSDIDVHQEIFTSEEVCFFQLNNIHSLSNAIEKSLENRKTLEINIRNRYLKSYTPQKMADKYLKLYHSLINN